jgi:hypothetical protein
MMDQNTSLNAEKAEYQQQYTDFENYIDESKDIIKKKCENLRNNIEENIENVINTVNTLKEFLLNGVDVYENKFMRDVDERMDTSKIDLYFNGEEIDKNINY